MDWSGLGSGVDGVERAQSASDRDEIEEDSGKAHEAVRGCKCALRGVLIAGAEEHVRRAVHHAPEQADRVHGEGDPPLPAAQRLTSGFVPLGFGRLSRSTIRTQTGDTNSPDPQQDFTWF